MALVLGSMYLLSPAISIKARVSNIFVMARLFALFACECWCFLVVNTAPEETDEEVARMILKYDDCILREFGWKRDLGQIVHGIQSFERFLHYVHLFNGCRELDQKLRSRGLLGAGLDREQDSSQDFNCCVGFSQALALVLHCLWGAILCGGPLCSSWIWIARFQTKRSLLDLEGDSNVEVVASSNRTASWLSGLCYIAHIRGVRFWFEQPVASIMFEYQNWKVLFYTLVQDWLATIYSTFFRMFAFGAKSMKPTRLRGTWERLPEVPPDNANNDGEYRNFNIGIPRTITSTTDCKKIYT